MSQSLSGDFTAQELEKCLSDLQSILNKAKPLTINLSLEPQLREVIINCMEGLQSLLAQEQSEYTECLNDTSKEHQQELVNRRQRREAERARIIDDLNNGVITIEQYYERLDNLE